MPDGRLVYTARQNGILSLVVSDGSESNTIGFLRLSDDSPDTADPAVTFLGLTHESLLFSLSTAEGSRLLSTNSEGSQVRVLYSGPFFDRIGTLDGDAIIEIASSGDAFVRTDGTFEGTSGIELTNSASFEVLVGKDRINYLSTDGALWSNGGASWKSRRVAPLLNVSLDSSDSTHIYPIDDDRFAIYVSASSGESGLWISNGTAAGTRRIADLSSSGAQLQWIRPLGDRVVYALDVFSNSGVGPDDPWLGLWTTDGTPNGTRRILSGVQFNYDSLDSRNVVTSGNRIFAATTDGRIFRTDGTTAGTAVAASLRSAFNLRTVGNDVFFSTDNAWRDGPEVMRLGTHGPYAVPVEPRGTGGTYVLNWATSGDTAYYLSPLETTPGSNDVAVGLFRLRPGSTRSERVPFVVSDERGPLVPVPSSFGARMSVAGSKLILRAGHAGATDELPVMFDPATGKFTVLPNFDFSTANSDIAAAVLLPSGGAFFEPQYGGASWFLASPGGEPVSVLGGDSSARAYPLDASHALITSVREAGNNASFKRLFISDGSTRGTKDIAFHTAGVTDFEFAFSDGRYAYYRATDRATSVRGLWRTDGTRAGTVRLRDDLQAAHTALTVAGVTYFCGAPVERDPETGSYDAELWRTDGTPAGTRRAVDLVPGAQGSYPDQFHFDGKHIYFTANLEDGRRGIFRSDGTPAGTAPIAALPRGADGYAALSVDRIVYLDGVVYLLARPVTSTYAKLYRCDLRRGWLTSDSSFSNPIDLAAVNGKAIVIGYRRDEQTVSVSAVDLAGRSTRLADDVGDWDALPSLANFRDAAGEEHLVGSSSDALFATDGTPGGTRDLHEKSYEGAFDPPSASSQWFTSGTRAYIAMNSYRYGSGEVFALQSPEARIAPGAAVAERGTVKLSAAPSTDPDPYETLTYTWDLDGDGVFGEVGIAAGRGDEVGATPTFRAVGVRGTSERVRLRVENSAGLASIATTSVRITPLAPAGLVATRRADGAVELRWADRSRIEGGFSVERSLDGTTWARVGGAMPNGTTLLDARAPKGRRVAYRVWAVQGSAPSGVAWVD